MEGGTRQYYLAGRRLARGAEIEVLLRGDRWLRGTFEWNGQPQRWPGLRLPLGGVTLDGSYSPSLVAPIPPAAVLRWPDE